MSQLGDESLKSLLFQMDNVFNQSPLFQFAVCQSVLITKLQFVRKPGKRGLLAQSPSEVIFPLHYSYKKILLILEIQELWERVFLSE